MEKMNLFNGRKNPEDPPASRADAECERIMKEGEFVRWDIDKAYGLSTVSESAKWTSMVSACTVVVVSGISEKTGKRISFMAHGLPTLTVPNRYVPDGHVNKNEYWALMHKSVQELIHEVAPRSIEISLFGGMLHESRDDDHGEATVASIIETGRRVRGQIQKATGAFVNPVVMSMPNAKIYSKQLLNRDSNVAYDTVNDRFYTERTEMDQSAYEWKPVRFSEYIAALRHLHADTAQNKDY